jgi:uncharacterized membrane protein YuzA (DUF378 family)
MKNFSVLDMVIGAILIVGGVNWGMIGFFDINLVSAIFGEMTIASRIVYALVGLSALYIVASALFSSPANQTQNRVVHP